MTLYAIISVGENIMMLNRKQFSFLMQGVSEMGIIERQLAKVGFLDHLHILVFPYPICVCTRPFLVAR